MTLSQALALVNSTKRQPGARNYYLACGFEPLHLATFLRAYLIERSECDVEVQHGVYGDLYGNIESASRSTATAAAVVLEWSDIDPRLGLRSSGGWSMEALAGVSANCIESFARVASAIEQLSVRMPVAFAAPSLPLPPVGNTICAQNSVLELELEQQLAAFLVRIARISRVWIIRAVTTESSGPRLDAKMELLAGFPYTIPFASALAKSLATVLCQPIPKKGLITDLDGTLWAGICGEVGVEGISWSQEHHTQAHGLYQQMLGHLADCGVLLAACSKNEPATAEAALARKDLFLTSESFFPVCANWGPKSASVRDILHTWNIAADAVVFVDDSPMELEEVKTAHPGITCLPFNGKDPAAVWDLLHRLRDLFGKPLLTEEDRLRHASVGASSQLRRAAAGGGSPEFLQTLEGTVTIAWRAHRADPRPLELINKTNQFNLNGRRIGESEWRRMIEADGAIVAVVSYADKFGPLGKIAVLLGSRCGGTVKVSHWVMSCRAFSRRIEHHVLDRLFEYSNAEEVEFAFAKTERNGPLQEFFVSLGVSPESGGPCRISRKDFLKSSGTLPHAVSNLTE